jgi:hypothetical protein
VIALDFSSVTICIENIDLDSLLLADLTPICRSPCFVMCTKRSELHSAFKLYWLEGVRALCRKDLLLSVQFS